MSDRAASASARVTIGIVIRAARLQGLGSAKWHRRYRGERHAEIWRGLGLDGEPCSRALQFHFMHTKDGLGVPLLDIGGARSSVSSMVLLAASHAGDGPTRN
jgi:hypothetical protein